MILRVTLYTLLQNTYPEPDLDLRVTPPNPRHLEKASTDPATQGPTSRVFSFTTPPRLRLPSAASIPSLSATEEAVPGDGNPNEVTGVKMCWAKSAG